MPPIRPASMASHFLKRWWTMGEAGCHLRGKQVLAESATMGRKAGVIWPPVGCEQRDVDMISFAGYATCGVFLRFLLDL